MKIGARVSPITLDVVFAPGDKCTLSDPRIPRGNGAKVEAILELNDKICQLTILLNHTRRRSSEYLVKHDIELSNQGSLGSGSGDRPFKSQDSASNSLWKK